MYTGLCECCFKRQKGCVPILPPVDTDQQNRFDLLSEPPLSDGCADRLESIASQYHSRAISVAPATPSNKHIPRLTDAQLGDACGLCKNFEVRSGNPSSFSSCLREQLQQMNGLVLAANKVWEKAARHECPSSCCRSRYRRCLCSNRRN